MDAPRREYERPLGEGQLRCRVWYPTWNIRQEDGACIHRPSVQWALHFVDRGRWQHVVRRIDSRHPRRKLRDGRHSHPRSWSPAVRAVEVHGRRRELHSLGGRDRLSESDARRQRRNHSVELRLDARRQPRGAGPEHRKHDLRGCVSQKHSLPLNTGGGVWRSTDNGANWTQIKAALNAALNTDRAEFAVTMLGNGNTRMYVGEGTSSDSGSNRARFFRSDDAANGTPVFTDLPATQSPVGQTIGYCTGQCWYDNFVVSPAGYPDTVYVGGSFSYGSYGFTTNGRGVLYSTDAGASFSDMTWDATTNPTP